MNVAGSPQTVASTVVNEKVASPAMLSGGSSASWSLTWLATTVTVHVSFDPKSVLTSSVNVVGPPETTAACVPVVVHATENHGSVTSTGSENVIETSRFRATFTAPA